MTVYEVGRCYSVPCVQLTASWHFARKGAWIPVLLPKHEDSEVIDFPYVHYHVDWRFASDAQLGKPNPHPFAVVLMIPKNIPYRSYWPDTTPEFRDEIVYRSLLCKRELPTWPHLVTPWIGKLQEEYADKKVTICGKCPHRGVDLSTIEPRVIDLGTAHPRCIKICPGHGLVWGEDGENVSYKHIYQEV